MIAVQRTCLSQRYLLCAPVLGTVYGHQHASSPTRHDVRFQPRVSVTFRVTGFASGAETVKVSAARITRASALRVGDDSSAEYEGVRVHYSHCPESRRHCSVASSLVSTWNEASLPANDVVTVGAAGAIVSTTTTRSADAVDTFPVASVAVAT